MSSPQKHLVVVDFPAIKSFVFGTDKLVEIRGGSSLLDHLNRNKLPEFLNSKLGAKNVDCIFVGGGAGQFIINAEPEQIDAALEEFRGLCRNHSGGGLALNFEQQLYAEDYVQAKDMAYQKLRQKKEENPISVPVTFHTGLIRDCDSCSGYAQEYVKHGGETHILCSICAQKTRFAQNSRNRLWDDFVQFAATQGFDEQWLQETQPTTFEHVGKACSAKPDHVGLIYADGNAMGNIVQQISSPEDFEFFSRTVDQSLRTACHQAICEHCLDTNAKHIPALILMLGGDDLLVYTTADRAIPLSLSIARKFEDLTRQAMAESQREFFARNVTQGLTISLGIAFGKHHTPFSLLLGQAEELLQAAKTKGSQDQRCSTFYAPTYLDCHFTTQFNQIRVADSRREHLTKHSPQGETLYLTSRPWDQDTADKVWEQAERLAHSDIPRSRLKRLGQAPDLGKVGANLEFYTLLSRTKGKSHGKPRKTLLWETLDAFGCRLDQAPWQKETENTWNTYLTDLIELSELVPRQQS